MSTPTGWLCRHIEENRREHRLIDIPGIWIFVASFSSEPDLLGQWRAYADDGQGYAIGFNSLPLPTGKQTPSSLTTSLAIDFGPCVYDESEYRARVRGIILSVSAGIDKYVMMYCDSPEHLQKIAHEAFGASLARLATLVPFLKDPTYAEEKEWRLIMLGTPDEKLTRPTKRYGDASYIKVSMTKPDRMDLHQIVSGPRVSGPDFARGILDRCGYGHVAIASARVPYR